MITYSVMNMITYSVMNMITYFFTPAHVASEIQEDKTVAGEEISVTESSSDESLEDIEEIVNWDFTTTSAFMSIDHTSKQLAFYLAHGAHPSIITLIKMSNRQFGCTMEKIVRQMLGLSSLKDTTCDAMFGNIRVEIKSSRYWISGNTADFRWQHIEPEHMFDIIIFVAVECNDLVLYGINRATILSAIQTGQVCQQGGGRGQGYWCTLSKLCSFLTKLEPKTFCAQLVALKN